MKSGNDPTRKIWADLVTMNKGDFISVISRRGNEAENLMSTQFCSIFNGLKSRVSETFKCRHFELSKMPLDRVPTVSTD